MEWQPIETAPPQEVVVLYYPERPGRSPLPAMYRVNYPGSTPNRRPTHWMPLPPPPQDQGEKT